MLDMDNNNSILQIIYEAREDEIANINAKYRSALLLPAKFPKGNFVEEMLNNVNFIVII